MFFSNTCRDSRTREAKLMIMLGRCQVCNQLLPLLSPKRVQGHSANECKCLGSGKEPMPEPIPENHGPGIEPLTKVEERLIKEFANSSPRKNEIVFKLFDEIERLRDHLAKVSEWAVAREALVQAYQTLENISTEKELSEATRSAKRTLTELEERYPTLGL